MSDLPVPVVSAPDLPAPLTQTCANCGATLIGEYCVKCGQRDEPHVHTIGHFAAEAFESITHADSRLWRTLGYLLVKPGRLTHEFFDGRRARYLPPFRLYLVISLLFFLVAGMPKGMLIEIDGTPMDKQIVGMNEAARTLEGELAATPGAAQAAAALRADAARKQAKLDGVAPAEQDQKVEGLQENNIITEFCKGFEKPDPKANKRYASVQSFCKKSIEDRGRALGEAVVHNIPRAMFVFLPLLALFMMLLYWRPKRYYVEHLLFLVHNHAFVFLALSILYALQLIPVIGGHLGLLEAAVWIYIVYYIFRAMRVYYGQSRKLTLAKYLTVGVAYISTSLLVLLLTAIYSALTF